MMRVPLDPEVDMHQQTVRYAVDLPEPEYWEDNLMLRDSLINMVDERFAPGPKGKWYAKSHFDDAPENAAVCFFMYACVCVCVSVIVRTHK